MSFNKLGAIPSPHDDRDYKFSELIGGASTIPDYHNDSNEIVRNQKNSMMCGAFAGASYRYSQEWYQNNNQDLFSTTMIYGADNSYSGEGMYGRDLAKILVNGVCKAKNWEILGDKSKCRLLYRLHESEISEELHLYRTTRYYFCNSWTEILFAISATNGCIIMMPVYSNWYDLNCPNGILGQNRGEFYGYHFIFAMDYIKKENGFYRIRFKNSWGESWGDKGYGYIDTDVNGFEEAFAVVDDIDEVKKMLYKDVSEDKWYSEDVRKVSENGYMLGDGDNIFRPEDPITRAEMAAIICRLKGL